MKTLNLYFIVGEASGDAIGESLLKSLKSKNIGPEFWSGVGGPAMESEGFQSQRNMHDLCVMGLFEVIKHIPRLRHLILETVKTIEAQQPDIVVSIDLPDFNFRVAKLLKARGVFKGKIVHYVAPTVWAWRPGRAQKVAQFLDGMICLFPFEPPYFEKHGLNAVFAGHPLIEREMADFDGTAFRQQHHIPAESKVLGVLFGSRQSELKTTGPILIEALRELKGDINGLDLVCPTLPHLSGMIADLTKDLGLRVHIITSADEKWPAFQSCDAALAVSGTVGLELAYANIPHVIAYKTSPATWWLMNRLVRVQYAHLVNLIFDRFVIPEFIQDNAEPKKIAQALGDLLHKNNGLNIDVKPHLKNGDQLPSDIAADFILNAV